MIYEFVKNFHDKSGCQILFAFFDNENLLEEHLIKDSDMDNCSRLNSDGNNIIDIKYMKIAKSASISNYENIMK